MPFGSSKLRVRPTFPDWSFRATCRYIVAIFYPFSQFCERNISILSLQKQPNTAPNLFQRGVEYGKYDMCIHTSGVQGCGV